MQTSLPDKSASVARTALLLVLAAETTLFGTLLMVYLYLRASSDTFFMLPLSDVLLTGANTIVLLVSAFTARQAVQAIQRDDVAALRAYLTSTLALGLIFVGGQIFEFGHSGMAPDDAAFGGVYFTLIGFHALHVLAGGMVLLVNRVRAQLGDFSRQHYVAIQIGTWFWFYVVAVWLVLYLALYGA
jgi:cytochrome c oxidase subunit 3